MNEIVIKTVFSTYDDIFALGVDRVDQCLDVVWIFIVDEEEIAREVASQRVGQLFAQVRVVLDVDSGVERNRGYYVADRIHGELFRLRKHVPFALVEVEVLQRVFVDRLEQILMYTLYSSLHYK